MSFDSRRTMAPLCAMDVGNNPPVYRHFMINALEAAAAAAFVDTHNSHLQKVCVCVCVCLVEHFTNGAILIE